MDRVQQKGTNPYQLLPNLSRQLIFLRENVCADSFENFEEFTSYYFFFFIVYCRNKLHSYEIHLQ